MKVDLWSRMSGTARRPFVGFLCVLAQTLVIIPSSHAKPVKLDEFIGGIEKGCELSKSLETFRSELNARYSYEEGMHRLQKQVHVPEPIKQAVGRAEAIRHSEHTTIRVPLSGTYRGLPTLAISFDVGHSNGINVITLSFGVPAKDVEKVIGADVSDTMQKFESDPETKDFVFSAKILSTGSRSQLVCILST